MANSVSRVILLAEAKKRNIAVSFAANNPNFCKFVDQRGRTEIVMGTRPMRSSANGTHIADNKVHTLNYAISMGYTVPEFMVVPPHTVNNTELAEFLSDYQTVVVKPTDAQQSAGVTVGVTTLEQLQQAILLARESGRSGEVIVQRQIYGRLYRLFVINGKLVAASERNAAAVIGTGKHTIEQLIEKLNQDPRRGYASDTPLKKIKLADVTAFLGQTELQRIPRIDEVVKISSIDSVSAGGQSADVTAAVHPDWKAYAGSFADSLGLFVCGYDVICEDISQPLNGSYIPLLEINTMPGLKLHHYPTAGGKPVNVAALLMDELFPKL